MADTVTSLASALMTRGGFPALGLKVGVIEHDIDLADANLANVAAGLGALATNDIIRCLTLPQGTVVLHAGLTIKEKVAGATALSVTLGVTGVVADAFVDNEDIGSSTSYVVGDIVTGDAAQQMIIIGAGAAGAASDTVDLFLEGVTGAITAGVLTVWAIVADVGSLLGE